MVRGEFPFDPRKPCQKAPQNQHRASCLNSVKPDDQMSRYFYRAHLVSSRRCPAIFWVLMPRAYTEMILSSKPGIGDRLRIEAALPVAQNLDLDLAGVGGDGLAAIAVANVASLLILPEMLIHLGLERAFSQCVLQPIQLAALLQVQSCIAVS